AGGSGSGGGSRRRGGVGGGGGGGGGGGAARGAGRALRGGADAKSSADVRNTSSSDFGACVWGGGGCGSGSAGSGSAGSGSGASGGARCSGGDGLAVRVAPQHEGDLPRLREVVLVCFDVVRRHRDRQRRMGVVPTDQVTFCFLHLRYDPIPESGHNVGGAVAVDRLAQAQRRI